MKKINLLIIVAVLIAFIAIFFPYISEFLSLEYIKEQQQVFENYYKENPFFVISSFFIIYILLVSFSIPQAAILTILSGALFGFVLGTIIASFASSIGALFVFLIARFVLGDKLQKKYPHRFKKINEGIEKEGSFYLFSLRLVPVFPFFLINLLMGITKIKAYKYYAITQIGALPGTMVYVYLGTTLADLDSLQGQIPIGLIIAFTLIGVAPLVFKKALDRYRNQ